MTQCPDIDALIDIVNGVETSREITEHVRGCPRCSDDLRLIAMTKSVLALGPPPEGAIHRLMTRVDSRTATTGRTRGLLHGLGSFVLATVTAVLALAPSSAAAQAGPAKMLVFAGLLGLTAAVLEPQLLRPGE